MSTPIKQIFDRQGIHVPGGIILDDDPSDGAHPRSVTFTFGPSDSPLEVSELIPAGWRPDDIVCADPDGGTSVDVSKATAFIDADPGESIVCIFVNSKESEEDDIRALRDAIDTAPDEAFKAPGHRTAMSSIVDAIETRLEQDDLDQAAKEAQILQNRVDGCHQSGTPDGDDWVTDCSIQERLHEIIEALIGTLSR